MHDFSLRDNLLAEKARMTRSYHVDLYSWPADVRQLFTFQSKSGSSALSLREAQSLTFERAQDNLLSYRFSFSVNSFTAAHPQRSFEIENLGLEPSATRSTVDKFNPVLENAVRSFIGHIATSERASSD